jgi:hypothetical protein
MLPPQGELILPSLRLIGSGGEFASSITFDDGGCIPCRLAPKSGHTGDPGIIESAGEPGSGARFDREAGATCGGWTRGRKPDSSNSTTRHAAECAE